MSVYILVAHSLPPADRNVYDMCCFITLLINSDMSFLYAFFVLLLRLLTGIVLYIDKLHQIESSMERHWCKRYFEFRWNDPVICWSSFVVIRCPKWLQFRKITSQNSVIHQSRNNKDEMREKTREKTTDELKNDQKWIIKKNSNEFGRNETKSENILTLINWFRRSIKQLQKYPRHFFHSLSFTTQSFNWECKYRMWVCMRILKMIISKTESEQKR